MTFPFTHTKVYTTALTHDQLVTLLSRLHPTRQHSQFYQVDNYSADLIRSGFVLRNAYPRQNLPAMPTIRAEITQSHPVTIRLKITPNYFLIAFLLLFPLIFIPSALFSDDWTINGIHRAPVLAERLEILLTGGGIPLLLCYVGVILPVQKAEDWIVKKLMLR
ncbi:hypothetical protein [Hymenobacter metallicola]|uniref:Uncharacterized protein n=1 Tax=Hymenobacter metallicola TaxID=2563114 RepID=A0A4Z0PTF2_9BACT|nr:hypothetical protein [Hymenobacter metallicola]TGE20998.1 hypothetical protein E5K02_24860 [Hymenobacter metallicola]